MNVNSIQNNIMALNTQKLLIGNQMAIAKNLQKMSSGYRINSAADDAAGLAVSEKMRSQVLGVETAARNAQDGISMIQTAEGALTEVHSMLNRMTELAGRAANGTFSDDERKALDFEFQALKSEVDRISSSTNFNGKNLLDGNLSAAKGGMKLQIGDTADKSNIVSVDVENMSTKGLGMSKLSITSLESAQGAIGAIKDVINSVSSQRASLGAMQNRQEHTINSLNTTIENMTAAESRIRDTDMAKEMMSYTKNNIMMQAAQSMLAQTLMVPQSVISLLR